MILQFVQGNRKDKVANKNMILVFELIRNTEMLFLQGDFFLIKTVN